MKSPAGRRGSICAHFGWTYEYLTHGISYPLLTRMLIDAPDYSNDDDKTEPIALDGNNIENLVNAINNQ